MVKLGQALMLALFIAGLAYAFSQPIHHLISGGIAIP